MLKDVEHIGHFIAYDEDGNDYGINIFVEIIDAGVMGDPDATIKGLNRLLTDDGDNVNRIEKGKYKIVQTDVAVSSNDPDAP